MSFNIVDLVKDQVKGQLIGHMGNLLGDEGGKATGAVDSIIPALLGGISGAASTGNGADSLFGAVQNQDDGLLDNMSDMLSGGQASNVIEGGNSILSNLFGSGGLGKLAGALSSHSGVSKGGTSSLMGMLAPILLGILKRKVMGEGLNASGLASMLSSQSSNIGAAMPQGLSDQLSSSGFLSSIGGAGAGIAAGAANLSSGAQDAVSSVTDSASAAVGGAGAGIAAGAANLSSGAQDAVSSVTDNASAAVGNARDSASAAVGNARDGVSNAVGGATDNVSSAVGGVADSARDGVANASEAVSDGAKQGGSMFRWLLPLVVLAGLAWAAFTYLVPGAKDAATDAAGTVGDTATSLTDTATDAAATATDAVSDTASAAVDATKDAAATATDAVTDVAATATDAATSAVALPADPAEVSDQLTGLFSGATETLGGITDIDSAKAAIPALTDLSGQVDSVSDMFGSLPDAARGPVSTMAEKGMGQLMPIIDKVKALPGIGAIINPILEPMVEKMQEFAG